MLVISRTDSWDSRLTYTLAIEERAAMGKLRRLQSLVFLLLAGVTVISILISLAFSVQSGKPVNMLVRTLKARESSPSISSYSSIQHVVDRILEELCKHAEGMPCDYARAACDRHFTLLGFSDHTPLPFGRPSFR